MAQDTEDYVLFEDSVGNVVSNDPRWKAAQTLKASGVDVDQVSRDAAELEELRAFKRAHEVAQAPNEFTGTADVEEPEDDEDDDAENPYADVKGKDLSALARERGIEVVKGMRAGDVRQALAAQDLGKASA
jgi:hypothetical protein